MDWNSAFGLTLRFLAVLLLVGLNGFFVSAEFALVKVRETQLGPLIARGHRRAKVAEYILHRLDAFLSATQLGITLASLGLGWIGEPVFIGLMGPVFEWLNIQSPEVRHMLAFGVGFSAITFLHISAGEQAPKWWAIQKALPAALFVSYPLFWFYRISYPFVMLLNWFSQFLLRQVGIEPTNETEHAQSEEELRLLFTSARMRNGTALGRNIMLNALDLPHRHAREVMRPRLELAVLDTDASMAECLDVAEKSRYSRFPLCEHGDLDRMLGVVHTKDLYAMRIKAHSGADLVPLARKLIYVPETAHLEKLLKLFLDRKLHMAVVVDEYGGTLGIVTLENILEELVGQIQDEFDQETPLLVRTSDTTWEAVGTLPLHELEEIVGESLHNEDVSTLSGWVTQRLGGFPKVGNSLSIGTCELRVEAVSGMRVAKVKLIKGKSEGPLVEGDLKSEVPGPKSEG